MMDGTGKRIKRLRKYKGMTQKQLAEIAGLSLSTIKQIEGEKKHSIVTVALIANALGVTISELKGGKE